MALLLTLHAAAMLL